MRRISSNGPGLTLPPDQGIYDAVSERMRRSPEKPVIARRGADGWTDVPYRALLQDVDALAAELLARGVQHGERVAVLGRTGYEWVVVDLALLSVGAVVVPVYPTSSAHQIRHVLADSGAGLCFAEDAEDAARLQAGGATAVATFAEVRALCGRPPAAAPERPAVVADDLATIVYTSGTTGVPKGCMLTHANMYASSANTVLQTGDLFGDLRPRPHDPAGAEAPATLLCLPLSHVFGRTILLSCLLAGTRTGLLPGVPETVPELRVFRPTVLALVPYALEKIRKSGPDRAALGGRLRHVVSGGATLDASTVEFYAELGVELLNCYGLTEAATAVTVNAPGTNRRGTVGRPIPGTEVAVAEDGEVLVHGPNVSPGYWPERSAGEWLHTGDLGRLDGDGFLVITGRRKEILVTSGGKNVAPTPLEDRIRLHPLVSNAMVVGDGRPFVAALVTLDEAALSRWAAARPDGPSGDGGWRADPALLAEVQQAVDEANSLVSRAESIRAVRVVAGDWTVQAGHLTPSMKLRRARIEEDFAADLEALYGVRV